MWNQICLVEQRTANVTAAGEKGGEPEQSVVFTICLEDIKMTSPSQLFFLTCFPLYIFPKG